MSDAYFLATVISAIGDAFSASIVREEPDERLLRSALNAIDHATTMDRLIPSFRNLITEAALKV
jgi:transcription initiation factor TFIID subunit 2